MITGVCGDDDGKEAAEAQLGKNSNAGIGYQLRADHAAPLAAAPLSPRLCIKKLISGCCDT